MGSREVGFRANTAYNGDKKEKGVAAEADTRIDLNKWWNASARFIDERCADEGRN